MPKCWENVSFLKKYEYEIDIQGKLISFSTAWNEGVSGELILLQ